MAASVTCRSFARAAFVTVAISLWSEGGSLAQSLDGATKRFENSIVTAPVPEDPKFAVASLKGNVRESAKLQLHFDLETRNIDELKARVAKGERVSPDEMDAKYSGDPESAKKLVKWLTQQGFRAIETSADHTSVYATGTCAQIEKSLRVTMKSVTHNGETMPAATTAPVLPRDVGDAVLAINGLQPWAHAIKRGVRRSDVSNAGNRTRRPAYKVYDILKAYNAYGLEIPGKGRVTGKGQTIAILIDRLPLMTDMQSFWQKNGLEVDRKQIEFFNVKGQGLPPPKEREETLDAQWASGIAPGATVRVYAAGSLFVPDQIKALEMIYAHAHKPDGPRHLSLSYGRREDFVSSDEMVGRSKLFLKLAGLGVTTFVSSGDAGSNPDGTGHARSDSQDNQVEYPASDIWVIAVGGTTLHAQNGKVVSETGWRDSGGGVSKRHPRPAWQSSDVWPNQQYRLVPDVSSVADEPGAFLIVDGNESALWGTSWSAPMWAGFSALVAEAREKQGKAPLGFLGPVFYGLKPGVGLHDITEGSNGAYKAEPGWDAVTGLGVPSVKELIEAIP